jgi:hypothetical protein
MVDEDRYTIIGRDIRGNEYRMRELTDEEKATLEASVDTRGEQKHMLVVEDKMGIALPDARKDRAMYYGGLEYDAKPRHILVDDEDYWIWNYEESEKYHEERWGEFEWEETNIFQSYLGPLED